MYSEVIYTIYAFVAGIIFNALFKLIKFNNINLFSKIKVDYSIEAKKNYRKDMAGEYAIYTRNSIFDKWYEKQTYADLYIAKSDAEKLKKELQLPKYY